MLVSVVVITYNSSKYVIETLESIYTQTYKEIELIISDDCSNDDTVKICEEWCNSHKERFESINIIESVTNTGIAPNVNRGYSSAKGEWIKGIAGDDMLTPDCIEQYIKFTNVHPEFKVVFSRSIPFGNYPKAIESFSENRDKREYFYLLPTSECQYWDFLIREACTDGPSIFMAKTIYDKIGGFDETIPMYEDYPFYLRVLKGGVRFGLMDKRVTKYRIHEKSISFSTARGKNIRMAQAAYDVYMKYRFNPLVKLYAPYAYLLKWFYLGQKSHSEIIRSWYHLLRVLTIIITRSRCLKVQNTVNVRKQLPEPLYRLYCERYFDN